MKTEKTKRLTLFEFIKKFKKEHPNMKSQQATRKAKLEYKKYIIKKKKDFKELQKLKKVSDIVIKKDKEFDELKNFDKKMSEEVEKD